ncbi:SigE-dependent sporulation protein [Ornithinibacillus sp. L9]|uniref:SigE-dependent sporulation protein n=1 Tax=Ornithinibacillus caprae TaxID=2678566 RepID=A0A6N8FNL4_9BACI|nr:SigE-dependent sporulation protein [Ornithinibacillus caprae]
MIFGVPWWVFMMVLFIFLSGYMAFRAMRAERELEEKYIEQQGKVYMDRIEEERQKRMQQERDQQVSH